MIRRGLQILIVGITALGAAPLFAQYAPPANFPAAVTVSGMPLINWTSFQNLDVNGYYVAISTSNYATTTFVRYNEDAQNAFRVRIDHTPNGSPIWRVSLWNSAENSLPASASFSTASLPTTPFTANANTAFTGGVTGTVTFVPHGQPLSDYELSFPDWASAGVKIPLGFTFGMSVWAAFLAATIALKWVRELSSAAT